MSDQRHHQHYHTISHSTRYSDELAMYFSSPVSNISPIMASVALSRSDSRDSATSTFSASSFASSTHDARPLSSSSFVSCMTTPDFPTHRRSSSSCSWNFSPYRSCQQNAFLLQAPSSYLSDDDLLTPRDQDEPTPGAELQAALSTEEQIEMLRQQREREQLEGQKPDLWWTQTQPVREKKPARLVRFAGEPVVHASRKSRKSSLDKRKAPTLKRTST